mmetsp:Transcript_21685/g.42599  ORF Transcript_21685/g.42599 Transcript_21685/m.42599 type:complete len:205 (+) Transcript_21685:443-1057(+)
MFLRLMFWSKTITKNLASLLPLTARTQPSWRLCSTTQVPRNSSSRARRMELPRMARKKKAKVKTELQRTKVYSSKLRRASVNLEAILWRFERLASLILRVIRTTSRPLVHFFGPLLSRLASGSLTKRTSLQERWFVNLALDVASLVSWPIGARMPNVLLFRTLIRQPSPIPNTTLACTRVAVKVRSSQLTRWIGRMRQPGPKTS